MKFTKDEIHNAILDHFQKAFEEDQIDNVCKYTMAGFVRDALDHFEKGKGEATKLQKNDQLFSVPKWYRRFLPGEKRRQGG